MCSRFQVFTFSLTAIVAAAFLAQQAKGNGPMMGPRPSMPRAPSISHAPSLRSGTAPSQGLRTLQQPRLLPQISPNILNGTSPAVPAQVNSLPSNAVQPTTVQPNTVQPNTQSAPAAEVAPAPNQALPAIPTTNAGIAAWVASMTPAERLAEIAKLQGEDNNLVNGSNSNSVLTNSPTPFATDSTLGSLSPAQQQAIAKAVLAGDPAKVQSLLTPQQLASQSGQSAVETAQMEQVMQPMLNKANDGALTTTDLANASSGISNAATSVANTNGGSVSQSALQSAMQPGLNQLYTNSQLIAALKAGQPAAGAVAGKAAAAGAKNPAVPRGNRVRMALVPGIDLGAIVPLDGMVLVGQGDDPGPAMLGEGNVALAAGFPVGNVPPAPDAADDSACAGIILTNAAAATVNYSVNGTAFSMEPKFEQSLDGSQTWTIEFDHGAGAGTARYTLAAGTYEFKQSDKGWELFSKSFKVTLDNHDNKIDFHYVRLNKRETLPAGQTQELTGACPPVLRFDDSAGKIKQKQLDSGAYKVALADDYTLDLFPADGVISPAAPSTSPPEPPAPPLAVDSGKKVILAAKPVLPAGGSSEKAVVPAKPLPPHFKIFDPLASIRTEEKSLAKEDKEGAKN